MGGAKHTERLRKKRKVAAAAAAAATLRPLPSCFSTHHLNELTFFPLLLAALATIHRPHSRALVKRLLRSHVTLIRTRPTTITPLPHGLLALLPRLLLSPFARKSSSLQALTAELVGAIALSSFEANTEIGSDGAVVDALVELVAAWRRNKKSTKRLVVAAACDAVLDLLSGPVSRERLSKSRALVEMLSLLCQVTASALQSLSGRPTKGNKYYSQSTFMKDKLLLVVLDAAIALVITCKLKTLEGIPKELSTSSLMALKNLLYFSQSGKSSIQSQEEEHIFNRKYDMAEVIFKLSMTEAQYSSCSLDTVRRDIFGSKELDFINFLADFWEDSPFLFRSTSKNAEVENFIFSSLHHCFGGETIDSVLSSVLEGLVSCPPIVSDELDIISFLNEVNGVLGCPLVYGQDIRVVRTQNTHSQSGKRYPPKEVHFIENSFHCDSDDSDTIFINDVQGCKHAFHEGFTIALRGMEFRTKEIAAIADALAILFGQPSVGANVYLTPPGSQGLSRHYDDHCVFVCQIIGQKQWILPQHAISKLPRLYEPLGSSSILVCDGEISEDKHFTLNVGDILYIPRGYLHEAHTMICDDGSIPRANGASLHLTFAIEIEPPFEWEGFSHIALHCWSEKQTDTFFELKHCDLSISNTIFVTLLHVAISMIGAREPTFRKACLVSAFPSSMHSKLEHHLAGHRTVFHHIIEKIDKNCSFLEAFNGAKEIIGGSDETLQRLRWLRHLPQSTGSEKDFSQKMFKDLEQFVQLSDGNIDDFMAAFSDVRSNFCSQAVFEDACKRFELLLEEYRNTRRQYMNGMLSLHSKQRCKW